VDRDGYIVVEAKTVKTRQRRTVPVEANLKAWIDAYAPEVREGPVVRNPTAWRKARAAIVREAGLEWGQDVARHTYATMYFGKYADRARLEANMGHVQGSGVLEANYKSLVTEEEAARYWGIMPTTEVEK
jgi:integrase